jgi:formylglycine-generating enzyme required for sulfatase activity
MRVHTIFPDEFPESWASDWGEDEYGLFMAFTYKGVRQNFRWMEPGTFLMGSPEREIGRFNNETQHKVTLSKGFWFADTTVTQVLWEAVMGENHSRFKEENRPVENIGWSDAQAFISKLNEMKPELRLCLPTEAQWEYACRAGTTTRYAFGDELTKEQANFEGSTTVDVANSFPNGWGLYDPHGNVFEWCQDWYGSYPDQSVVDPQGVQQGDLRVARGGAYSSIMGHCRSAYRANYGLPRRSIKAYGFRLARSSSSDLFVKASSSVTTVLFTHIYDV